MLSVLVSYSVIFSPIRHTAMAAEAPDLHKGDLGRLEKVRNTRLVLILLATERVLNRNYLIVSWPGFGLTCLLYKNVCFILSSYKLTNKQTNFDLPGIC